jgi:hypothetical protein
MYATNDIVGIKNGDVELCKLLIQAWSKNGLSNYIDQSSDCICISCVCV